MSARRSPRSFWFFAALGATLVVAWGWGRPAADWIYVRQAVRRGEPWRLLTGQLVHLTGWHLAWNLAGLLVVAMAFSPSLRPRGWIGAAAALGGGLASGAHLGGGAGGVAAGWLAGRRRSRAA